MPHTAIVALGSNIGDRAGYLRLAVEGLGQVTAMSRVYETDPVGGPKDQGAFLNMVVAIDTALDPFTLLRQCQQLEATAGLTFRGVVEPQRRPVLGRSGRGLR